MLGNTGTYCIIICGIFDVKNLYYSWKKKTFSTISQIDLKYCTNK